MTAPASADSELDLSTLAALESTGTVDQAAYEPVSAAELRRRTVEIEALHPSAKPVAKQGTSYAEALANRNGAKRAQAARGVEVEAMPFSLKTLIPRGVFGWFWAALVLFSLIGMMSQSLASVSAFWVLVIGLCFLGYGLALPGILARREGFTSWLMYRYVPGYQIYYVISRWEETQKCILGLIQGVALLMLGLLLAFRAGGLGGVLHHHWPWGGANDRSIAEVDDSDDSASTAAAKGLARASKAARATAGTGQREVLEPGVERQRIRLNGTGPGQAMDLWLYLPSGDHPAKSLPCVLIAPAGSHLFHGMPLGDGDVPEHVPYVKAGFAVMAYSLDGEVRGDTSRAFAAGAGPFMAAKGGVTNARSALDYVLAHVPEVNPAEVYAAGHSSAGVVALDWAAADPRVKAVAAYAPACDVEARLATALPLLEKLSPGLSAFAKQISPMNLTDQIHCPVLLFHADDDDNIPQSDNARFAEKLKAAATEVAYQTVPSGGHFESMMQQGIPAGIQFFEQHGAKAAGTAAAPSPVRDAN